MCCSPTPPSHSSPSSADLFGTVLSTSTTMALNIEGPSIKGVHSQAIHSYKRNKSIATVDYGICCLVFLRFPRSKSLSPCVLDTRAHGGNAFAVVSAVHRECECFIPRVGTRAL